MKKQNTNMPIFLIVILCVVLFNVVDFIGTLYPVLFVPFAVMAIIVIIIIDKAKKNKNNTQETTQDIFDKNINQEIFNQAGNITDKLENSNNQTICNDNCEHITTTQANKECKNCGAKNLNNAKRCDCCGNKL